MKKTITELTSKKLKAYLLSSWIVFSIGLFLGIIDSWESPIGFITILIGLLSVGITKIRIWWNHS